MKDESGPMPPPTAPAASTSNTGAPAHGAIVHASVSEAPLSELTEATAAPAPLVSSDEQPTKIAQYVVEKRIGRGGMGTVYACRDPLLDRVVAVKLLRQLDDETEARFERECRTLAKVRSPWVVELFGAGRSDVGPYLVMELVDGESLFVRLKRTKPQPLPVQEAVAIALDVAKALRDAASVGVVHRDVKPHNILLDAGGKARLTDFGLARAVDGNSNKITQAGIIMGSARYLAPEVIRGEPPTAAADAYSLGCVLYEMLAGRPPFGVHAEVEALSAHLVSVVPPLSETSPQPLPPALMDVVHRLLAKSPAARLASFDVIVRELEACLAPKTGETAAELDKIVRDLESLVETNPSSSSARTGPVPAPTPNDWAAAITSATARASDNDAGAATPATAGRDAAPTAAPPLSPPPSRAGTPPRAPASQLPDDNTDPPGHTVPFNDTMPPPKPATPQPDAMLSTSASALVDSLDLTSTGAASPEKKLSDDDTARIRVSAAAAAAAAGNDESSDDDDDAFGAERTAPSTETRARAEFQHLVGGARELAGTVMSGARKAALRAAPLTQRLRRQARLMLALIAERWAQFREKHADKFDVAEERLARIAGRFPIKRPLPLLAFGLAVSFAIGFVIVLVATSSPNDPIERIEDGEAALVLAELDKQLATPGAPVDPNREVIRGRALAKLGREREALLAYLRAGALGSVDERVQQAALSSLRRRDDIAEQGESVLRKWPSPEIDDELVELARGDDWESRQRAYAVLSARKALDKIDVEAFAIKNLETGETCAQRRLALDLVRKHGQQAALDAIAKASARSDNGCMKKGLRQTENAIRARLAAPPSTAPKP